MTDYPAIELASASLHGSGTHTRTLYKVEVRTSYHSPTVLDELVIDHCWRTLHIRRGGSPFAANIPLPAMDAEGADHGLVPYIAAEAHRWAFLAALEAVRPAGSLCVQTRLVAVELTTSFTTKETGVSETMNRSHCPPAMSARFAAAQGIEAGTGETREAGLDPKGESPVAEGDAPERSV